MGRQGTAGESGGKEVSLTVQDSTKIVQNIHPAWTKRTFDRVLSVMITEDIE